MRNFIINHFADYLACFQDEKESFERLKKQIENSESLTDRKNMNGHVTASGLVISPKGKILLIFHKAGQRFQQPGGHVDVSDLNIITAAMREIREETSLEEINLHPWHEKHAHPINIDSHYVAPRLEKDETEHYHHDFIYLFTTAQTSITLQQLEVGDYKWIDPHKDKQDSLHVKKSINKARELGII